jgi:aryl-alcohol dehydrogenase-like predicted oxidoreductase
VDTRRIGALEASVVAVVQAALDAGITFFDAVLTDQNRALVEALNEFATSRGHTLLELAVSWLLARQAVASVIAGATSPGQVRANAAAGWQLTGVDLEALDGIVAPAGAAR